MGIEPTQRARGCGDDLNGSHRGWLRIGICARPRGRTRYGATQILVMHHQGTPTTGGYASCTGLELFHVTLKRARGWNDSVKQKPQVLPSRDHSM